MKYKAPEEMRPGFRQLIYPKRDLSPQVRLYREKVFGDCWFHSGYPQTTWAEDLALLKERSNLTNSSRITYLGCGDDTEVQEAYPETTNVDIRNYNAPLKNFLLADATNLPFKNESFDGVVIKAFGGSRTVYREAERIVKQEGVVLVAGNLMVMNYDHLPTESVIPLPLSYLTIQNKNLATLRTLGESGLGLVEPLSYQAIIARKGLMNAAERAEIEKLMTRNRRHLCHLLETRDWEEISETRKIKKVQAAIAITRFVMNHLRAGRLRDIMPELREEFNKARVANGKDRITDVTSILKGDSSAERIQDVVPELLEALEEYKDLISPKAKAKILFEVARFEKAFARIIAAEKVQD